MGFILRVVFQLAVKSDTSSINPVREITRNARPLLIGRSAPACDCAAAAQLVAFAEAETGTTLAVSAPPLAAPHPVSIPVGTCSVHPTPPRSTPIVSDPRVHWDQLHETPSPSSD